MDGLELLVHNLSHSDLILGINTAKLDLKENTVIARPKFSNFHAISEQLFHNVSSVNSKVIISKSPICSRKNTNSSILGSDAIVPVGFNLHECPIEVKDLSAVRFRHDDKSILLQHHNNGDAYAENNNHLTVAAAAAASAAVIDNAYFPLLAVLIPKWLAFIKDAHQQEDSFDKVIVLVSGRGTPNVQNSGTANDNSTKCTAELMKLFIEQTYPQIMVRLLHSDSNLFRYDENIVFVKNQLLPLINEYRDQLVTRKAAEWKEHMRVSLSFADGSSARISAINASLRYYRPSYMHFWQLKSFWREQLICEDDIECHSYEEIATAPAMRIADTVAADPLVHAVVQEMARFREEFTAVVHDSSRPNDLSTFWLRKTKKPVLAVLLVQKPGQPFKLYRGTNMEVSMPTGSLCAERNVIGTALSADITLRREDIKLVAVYSASMPAPPSSSASSSAQQRSGSVGSVGMLERASSNSSHYTSATATANAGAGAGSPLPPSRSNSISFAPSSPLASSSSSQQHQHSSSYPSQYSEDVLNATTPVANPAGNGQLEYSSQANTPIGTPSPAAGAEYRGYHLRGSGSGDGECGGGGGGDGMMTMSIDTHNLPPYASFLQNNGPVSTTSTGAKSPQTGGVSKRKIMSLTSQTSQTSVVTAPAGASAGTSAGTSEGSEDSSVASPHAAKKLKREDEVSSVAHSGLRPNSAPFTTSSSIRSGPPLQRSSAQTLQANTASNGKSSAASTTATAAAAARTKMKTVAFSVSSSNLASIGANNFINSSGADSSSNGVEGNSSSATSSTVDAADVSSEAMNGTPAGGAVVPVCLSVGTSASTSAQAIGYTPTIESFTVDKDDLNPLKPCGACNEWLKKIAEVNPQLKVITFTDADCRGVHIEQIDD